MVAFAVTDWNDAYENGRNIPRGSDYPAAWVEPSSLFRASARARLDIPYGEGARHRYDLFLPEAAPKGLFVFVHGGYWMALDKSYWSHLAAGPLAQGWAVSMPSYDLCPEVSIAEISAQTGAAITHAANETGGQIVLSGHSAGGHLVTAMMCEDSPLPVGIRSRLSHVLSISGLHDLRPMLRTERNTALKLDMACAEANSPALKRPMEHVRLTTWVGGGERQEFLRQSALLSNIWHGLGCVTQDVVAPNRHHFNVIDDLADPESVMLYTVLGDAA
ncbi:alpha/beta hydrolase [Sedimentitalea todarodis]|uniref:Alpha/beta hydrolase n=1 Tax=Sedimentitalea todarodis TaxID=1631240 RepID=A0ABU3VDQ1_9RHOB|nr:alpha/beta hydrolase [Sedimentitalea todarodis]MDU9004298.1 alpha/beta hydrolase [Sedimentitalea todarodis]